MATTPRFLERLLKALERLPEETVRVPQRPGFFYTSASVELAGSKSPRDTLFLGLLSWLGPGWKRFSSGLFSVWFKIQPLIFAQVLGSKQILETRVGDCIKSFHLVL